MYIFFYSIFLDKSVLENYHLASSFKLLMKSENNIFQHLPQKSYDEIRKYMIDMVLATDLSHHFEFISHFKSTITKFDRTNDVHRLMILKMALKCSDVGHAAKVQQLHIQWSHRVIEEFYRQGDKEREAGIPISPVTSNIHHIIDMF